MSYPLGSIPLTGSIGTTDVSDTFATHLDYLGYGSHRTAADTTVRDAITVDRRSFGMLVTTQDQDPPVTYILNNIAMGGASDDLDDNSNWEVYTSGAGTGTVTSVGLALPSIFTVSGSPVTGSGTLTGTLNTQSANLVFAGPTSGGAATPTFRALVAADLPAGTGTVTGTGTTNTMAKFTSSSSIGNSLMIDDGTATAIGTTIDSTYMLGVGGSLAATNIINITGTTPSLRFGGAQAIEKSGTSVVIGSHGSWTLVDIQRNAKINTVNAGLGPNNIATNTIFGVTAGNAITTGDQNLFMGYQAGLVNAAGLSNVAVGYQAMKTLTSASGATAVGWKCMELATASESTAVGESALRKATGANNTAMGGTAAENTTSGTNNAAYGISSLRANTTGSNNAAFGREAISSIIGSDNIGIGSQVASGVTSGSGNIFIGNQNLGTGVLSASTSSKFLVGNGTSFLLYGDLSTGQVKVGNGSTLSLTSTAIFELVSTTRGFLPPRMTTTERDAISSPAQGLIIFNTTTTNVEGYNGTTWQAATGSGGTVTSVSVVSANGFAGSVATATSTPAITISTTITGILKGNGTAVSAATNADITGYLLTGYVSGAGTVAATDSILQAIQKLNGNITALVTGVSSVSGTSNRITVSPTTGAVVVDISSSYVGQATITTLGTIATGTWNASLITGTYGGTGVNNGSSTITIGGNVTFSGAFATTVTVTGTTTVTLPTSGTLYGTATGSITSSQLATSLSDETGSGAAVFGTSPTISAAAISGTWTGNATFSGALNFTASGINVNASNSTYRTTNGGSNITANSLFDLGGSASTAGSLGIILDNNATGLGFTAANGTRRILRGAIVLTDLTNTAGSEAGGLAFLTQSGGTAASEKARFASTGEFLINTTTNNLSKLQVNGSVSFAYIAKTGTYTLTASDYFVDCTSGTFTATLPTAVGIAGRSYIIKNSGTGTITIGTTSSQTIDGVTTKTLNTQYAGYKVTSDGANWKITAAF